MLKKAPKVSKNDQQYFKKSSQKTSKKCQKDGINKEIKCKVGEKRGLKKKTKS